ncbi:Eco57I restriction-modification methylase domain-containing protein [Haloferax sp. YSSS75]|uniref:Eco57I restriction-modification methylase domain-containing protein n=1 Tax=Haloferax sp. YSSS75 TaxID=3388564 RepID=UPI00398CD8E1
MRQSDVATDVFDSLDEWVTAVDAVVGTSGDGSVSADAVEHGSTGSQVPPDDAVELVNTFVLVQTLCGYGVVDADWLRETWQTHERADGREETRAVLDAFFADVAALVEPQSGLVESHVTTDVDLSETDVEAFYRTLATVLGVGTEADDENPGITDYDFTQIDADVFGRIYERYLAEGRAGSGIYYTPRYVSEAVVADTVKPRLRRLTGRIETAVAEESWDDAASAVRELTEFSVLDPACGTGSFLVAAYATIRDEYARLFEFLDDERKSRGEATASDSKAESTASESGNAPAIERLESLQRTLGYAEDDDGTLHRCERTLAATLVFRHVYAVDVDGHALDVAKLNLWLEVVACDPHVCDDTPVDGSCVSPALDLNFGRGDALVGPPDERVATRLRTQYADEMQAVLDARDQFVDAPDDPAPLRRATASLAQIRGSLDSAFEASEVSTAILDETTPLYWPLQFWHVLGDGDGFDCVVGNPPWVIEAADHTTQYLSERYDHQAGQPDLYRYFLERSFTLTTGRLGMVTPNTWLSIPGAQQLRRLVFGNAGFERISFVPASAFTGVGQNSIVVVVDRQAPATGADDDDTLVPVGEIEATGSVRDVRTIRAADVEPPTYHVNPYVGTEEKSLVATMRADATELQEIADLTVGYQLYHSSLHTAAQIDGEVFHSETDAGPDSVPDTRSDALSRYHLDRSQNRYVDTAADFFRIPPRRFRDGEKLLLREVPSKTDRGLVATRSAETLLFPKSVISVVLTADEYEYEHLLGLLNSRLLYLASLVTGEKMGQDLFPRVSLTQLRGLPIEGTSGLTPLVTKMERLAATRRQFRRHWTQCTETPTTESRRLTEILDVGERRSASDETWGVASVCAPDGDVEGHRDGDALDRTYESFAVDGGTDDSTLVVSGLDGGVEHELLHAEFRNRSALQMVYLSLVALFESRAKVDHLGHVLEKTAVPVGDSEATGRDGIAYAVRTIADVERAVESDRKRSDAPNEVETDIVRIDDAVATTQMNLDAAVFDCYGLTSADAETVLSVLDIRESIVSQTVSKLATLRNSGEGTGTEQHREKG